MSILTIEKITPTNEGKTALLTLSLKTAFLGIPDAKRTMYYAGGILKAAADTKKVGETVDVNLDDYWHVKRPFYIKEKTTWVLLTYLHGKEQYPNGAPEVVFPEDYIKWLAAKEKAAA